MFIIIIRKVRPHLHKARSWMQGRRKSPTKVESRRAVLPRPACGQTDRDHVRGPV
jgi:hypothetical protein